VAAIFSIATVWVPALAVLSGYGWVIGAVLGGVIHWGLMRGCIIAAPQQV
jgi:NCS1 family nucleobase:cation symporter-1